MKLAFAALAFALLAPRAVAPAVSKLPSLPVASRARVDVGRESVLVTLDVSFDRGAWESGDLDVWVAFGAPGVPQAFDARLVPVAPLAFAASASDAGEPVPTERASAKPSHVAALVGPPHMAGEVVHVREPALRRAFAAGSRATLRLRSIHALPPATAAGEREVLVRLGAPAEPPLALALVEVGVSDARSPLISASASLCGPDSDPTPIAVHGAPNAASATSPLAVTRRPGDSLCVRWRTR